MDPEILYEDEYVVAINKPAGLMTHADGRNSERTVADWYIQQYPENKDVGESITTSTGEEIHKPGIVHRLDRDTSGVMILPKDQETFLFLKDQFQNRTVEKEYRAFVYGNIKEETGVVDRPIGRSSKDFRLWSAQRGARGKMREAVTKYQVLARDGEHTYLSLMPKTGRTHQLRVHMKAINHPIVCDSLYAPKRECVLGFSRLALHAQKLSIELPGSGVQTFEASVPEDFKSALEILRK